MDLLQTPLVCGATSLEICFREVSLRHEQYNKDDPVHCKIEMISNVGHVKQVLSTSLALDNLTLISTEEENSTMVISKGLPFQPTPEQVRLRFYHPKTHTQRKIHLGNIVFSQLDIQSFMTEKIQTKTLSLPKHYNQSDLSLTSAGHTNVQLKFIIDKTTLAFHLFQSFPEEILLRIFSFMNFRTLRKARLCCRQWYRMTCDERLLYVLGKRAQKKDKFEDARKLYLGASKFGCAISMDELGRMYQNGIGGPKDYEKAFMWYSKAAESNDPSGMNDLGWLLEKGIGCIASPTKAVYWYKKSASTGYKSGENNLGWCYQKGVGVEIDYEEAVKWYSRSAGHGNSSAMNNLAWCYHQGLGVLQSHEKAIDIYLKSTDMGNEYAMNSIGNMYLHGEGVERDIEKGVEWLEKASSLGHAGAAKRLESIKATLAREQETAREAERRATSIAPPE